MRRALDVTFATLVLVAFSLPMLIIAFSVRLTSKGRVLFSQERVGQGGRLFRLYKFRSMAEGRNAGSGLTKAGDSRVTPVGKYLRKFKLDELPQFYNILRGDMSLVGPRPKLPQYAEMSDMPYRPGITGAASLAFRNEEEILRNINPDEMDAFYDEYIKPLKARLDLRYMSAATPFSDLRIILATALPRMQRDLVPRLVHSAANSTSDGTQRTQNVLAEQSSAAD
jgi:lipopolysaccharide/colanic/teichoic acid biosynthesis glycosyltransferase